MASPSKRRMQARNNSSSEDSNRGLAVDIISSIDDNAMCDVMLLANDGGQVPASRFVLGARSLVLQHILFSKRKNASSSSSSSSSPDLRLPYSTAVVSTLVHYCRTNELLETSIFASCLVQSSSSSMDVDEQQAAARELVHLAHCAVAFELGGLETLVGNLASSICQVHPHLSCAMYDEATTVTAKSNATQLTASVGTRGAAGASSSSLRDIALGFIRRYPTDALLRNQQLASSNRNYSSSSSLSRTAGGGVSFLKAASLEQVLSDTELGTEEINLFYAIVQWSEYCVPSLSSFGEQAYKNNNQLEPTTGFATRLAGEQHTTTSTSGWATQLVFHDRRAEAKRMVAKCIDLSKIAPSDLMGVVSESGLVDEIDVSNALIQLALRIEREGMVEVSKMRFAGVDASGASGSSTATTQKRQHSARHQLAATPPRPDYSIEGEREEDANSITDLLDHIVTPTAVDTSGSSLSYEHFEHSNKRKPRRQHPKPVKTAPPQKEMARLLTPEQAAPPPVISTALSFSTAAAAPPVSVKSKQTKRGARQQGGGSSGAARAGAREQQQQCDAGSTASSVGSEIRRTVGLYLRDKVDNLCVHPQGDLSD